MEIRVKAIKNNLIDAGLRKKKITNISVLYDLISDTGFVMSCSIDMDTGSTADDIVNAIKKRHNIMETSFEKVDNTRNGKTVFTHFQTTEGWGKTNDKPERFTRVLYLGRCSVDGDLFAAYDDSDNMISIYKGIAGNEF